MAAPRLSAGNRLSASNRVPRQINRNLIFNQIRARQPISRADLARSTGLQRSTVSLIVDELLRERWIAEGQTGQIPRGRKPTFLTVDSQHVVLALDIHPAHAILAVTDLGGTIVEQKTVELPADPGKVIHNLLSAIRKTIAAHREREFQGIGMNLPGRFDPQLERLVFAPNLHWPVGKIKTRVEQATGLPVVVDNVANACALAEVWFGAGDSQHDLVAVNVSEGIGTGILANGRLLRGEGGVAGEFGHVQLDPNGLACGCGGRGCWETLASNRAGLRYYAEATGKRLPGFAALLQRTEAGDAAGRQAIERMCRALGRGMHIIASALAPAEIVVVGDITTVWPLAGPAMEAEIRRYRLAWVPRLRPARGGSLARLRSAAALVMSENPL